MTVDAADFQKDPDEVLDYTFNWTDWLEPGETISSSVITVTGGIILNSQSNTTFRATCFVSGGNSGVPYAVKDTIVTSLARTAVRTITIRVTPR